MTDHIIPEVNRRKKESGVTGQIVETLIGKQSRKVAFGIWGFIAANTFLATAKIDADVWWKCFLTCALLIGFGTILDSTLAKVGDYIASSVGKKINSAVNIVTVRTEETASDVPPTP